MAFVAIYDANVLYPSTLRDVLIRVAQSGLVQAKWTDQSRRQGILTGWMHEHLHLTWSELPDPAPVETLLITRPARAAYYAGAGPRPEQQPSRRPRGHRVAE